MKKQLLLFLLIISYSCKSQDTLSVNITQGIQHFDFTITDEIKAEYTTTIWSTDDITWQPIDSFSKKYDVSWLVTERLAELLSKENLMRLKEDNSVGLDGYYVSIRFNDSQTSKYFQYWSPDPKRNESCKIISEIRKQLWEDFNTGNLDEVYINTLPPGTYMLTSISSVRIDRFLAEGVNKTDFYKNTEQKIRFLLSITDTTKHREYPLIIIDNRYSYIADLNNYTLKDIKSFEIITKEQPERAIYGARAENGIVLVTTHKKK